MRSILGAAATPSAKAHCVGGSHSLLNVPRRGQSAPVHKSILLGGQLGEESAKGVLTSLLCPRSQRWEICIVPQSRSGHVCRMTLTSEREGCFRGSSADRGFTTLSGVLTMVAMPRLLRSLVVVVTLSLLRLFSCMQVTACTSWFYKIATAAPSIHQHVHYGQRTKHGLRNMPHSRSMVLMHDELNLKFILILRSFVEQGELTGNSSLTWLT